MSTVVKISPGGQVRIPKEIMERLHISTGDYIDFDIKGGGVIVRGKRLVDIDHAWFWTKEWQEAEKEASEDIKEGRMSKVFTTAEEGIKYLRKRRKELKKAQKN